MADEPTTTIITAAAGTLGSAIARRLAADGHRLLLVDIDGPALRALAIGLGGYALVATVADTTDEEQAVRLLSEHRGSIIGLVNTVGGEGDAVPITEHSIASFEATLRLNVTSALIFMKHVIPRMPASGGGSIVNIGSVSSVVGNPNDVAYTVAKHAIIGLTRAAASEWGHRGIRVNAVCPGPVEGPLMERFEASQPEGAAAVRQWYTSQTPARRYGTAGEVADAVAFLLSPQARYINGASIMLDGGLTAAGRPAD